MHKPSAALILSLSLSLFAAVVPLRAHEDGQAAAAAQLTADVATELVDVEGDLVALAEALPAEKFGWRPAEGVRSYVEIVLHVAGGNYFLGRMLGTPSPEGIDSRKIESSTTDKAKAIAAMKESYVHIRKVIAGLSAADLEAKVDFFGKSMSKRTIVLRVLNHSHEHLGQSIAYARMNGVVPPWSK